MKKTIIHDDWYKFSFSATVCYGINRAVPFFFFLFFFFWPIVHIITFNKQSPIKNMYRSCLSKTELVQTPYKIKMLSPKRINGSTIRFYIQYKVGVQISFPCRKTSNRMWRIEIKTRSVISKMTWTVHFKLDT